MNVLRPVTATALALWLGVLACVLGCSQAVLASTPSRLQISESRAAVIHGDSGKLAGAAPCCHQHSGTSHRDKQGTQTLSCCPLDATLIQKQDAAAAKSAHPYELALILFVFNPSFQISATNEVNEPTVCPAGREVLLKTHALRI